MTSITKLSISVGTALILLGLILYISTGSKSVTALIPSFFGVPILACGFIAKNEHRRKMAAHIAVLFALLGSLGGLGMGIKKTASDGLGSAQIGQLVMGIICLIYLVACIRSFISARKSS